MDALKEIKPEQEAPAEEKQGKKPYEEPRIIFKVPLEAMASVCQGTGTKSSSLGGCTVLHS